MQNFTTSSVSYGDSASAGGFGTFDEARSAADVVAHLYDRQEIADSETGAVWFRADGQAEWQQKTPPTS